MMALARLKRAVSSRLELQAVRKHRSRLGRHAAPRYSEYLEACRAEFRGARTMAHILGTQRSDPNNPGFDRIDW
jgi:hypothetical protein